MTTPPPPPPRRVQILPPDLSNQIAAGEVVERPASAVKELVENALDAGAKKIFIDLEDGGRKLIRVTDDGSGMSRDDATLAIQRHATSKIATLDDLNAISTLGFRGEALPSIASVSRFSLSTKLLDAPVGTLVTVEGGHLSGVQETACNPGTRIEVRDLFFNTPARLKFLKSEATELRRAHDIIMRLALVWNFVHFRLSHNDKVRLDIPPHPDPSDRIFALLGREVYDALHPLPPIPPVNGVTAQGFFSDPTFTQAATASQYTYVNGRFVNDRTISAAIQNAYQDLIPKNRAAVIVINVSVPPDMVDVNVHPTKIEVRFTSADPIFRTVFRALREGLARAPWINAGTQIDGSIAALLSHPINLAAPPPPYDPSQAPPLHTSPDGSHAAPTTTQPLLNLPSTSLPLNTQHAPNTPASTSSDPITWAERLLRGLPQPSSQPFSASPSPNDPDAAFSQSSISLAPNPQGQNPQSQNPSESRPLFFEPPPPSTSTQPSLTNISNQGFFSRLRYIGLFARHYIIATDGSALIVIDLRTVHERLATEHLLAQWSNRQAEAQQLLFPVQVELDALRSTLLEEHVETFAALGFELEPFGPRVFALKAVPSLLVGARYVQLIRDALDELANVGRARSLDDAILAAISRMARAASPKTSEAFSSEEAEALFLRMDRANLAAISGSQRPVFFKMPIADIDKKFDR